LLEIAKRINTFWFSRDKQWERSDFSQRHGSGLVIRENTNFLSFLNEIVNFPVNVAHAFGFASAVFIYDHLDAAHCEIHPPERFGNVQHSVSFFSILWNVIQSTPFFISSKDDQHLLRLLGKQTFVDYLVFSTEAIIETLPEQRLVVPQVEMVIEAVLCRGCPGYLAVFLRICELADQAQARAVIKEQFPRLISVVDLARNETLRQEFLSLVELIACAADDTEAGTRIDPAKMDELMSLPTYTVRVC
jgi:hypothetical protein